MRSVQAPDQRDANRSEDRHVVYGTKHPWRGVFAILACFGIPLVLGSMSERPRHAGDSQPHADGLPEAAVGKTMQATNTTLRPFTDEELCRAAHATANGRNPRDYKVEWVSGHEVHVSYTRQSDGKFFGFRCAIEDTEIRGGDDLNAGWYENLRFFYEFSADGRTVQISHWLMPTPEARRQAERLGSLLGDGGLKKELMNRRTFSKSDFGIIGGRDKHTADSPADHQEGVRPPTSSDAGCVAMVDGVRSRSVRPPPVVQRCSPCSARLTDALAGLADSRSQRVEDILC